MQIDDATRLEGAAAGMALPPRRWLGMLGRLAAQRGATPEQPPGRRFFDRTIARYGLTLVFVAAAILATFLIDDATGRFLAFPFYAAVVASAWLGTGPGVLSLLLTAVVVEDLWTPPLFDMRIASDELPSFIAFIVSVLIALAWSSQRRRAQLVLEATVQTRTADLVQSNTALQIEIAEREAAERERRRTELALRDAEAELARTLRLATVAELAAAIAHEINQPLAAIVANGAACSRSLAQQPPLFDNAREAADCVVADAHRAGDVIARIRSLFNKEAPRWEALDINELVGRVLALSRGAIERQRVVVELALAPALPSVMGDPVQLQQVIVNLITNALEAMAENRGRPRRLWLRSAVEGGNAVVVSVEDSGDGLDPARVSRLFDSFYTTKPGGIGVGLAISRSIVEAHGGSLQASSLEDRGARFVLTLPLATAVDPPAESPRA
ncbi:MAG TPA: ATP-binding protein [Stellaceae bacterium]|nr:ATP-binding protein [Stellaceae bacterium]